MSILEVVSMIFKSISIQNFLSLKKVDLELENRGLVLLNGENLDNPSLNNNGAGKSSILEAIVFVLYGRTLRGLKGDSVVNKVTGKNTKVFLDLVDDDGVPYRIARYRKHSTNKNKSILYRNSVDITPKSEADFEKTITDLLQADYETFTASLLYSAESFKFTTATDSEIKKTFDTILGLEILPKCRFTAKGALNITDVKLEGLIESIGAKEVELDQYNSELKYIQSSESEWVTQQKDKAIHIQESKQSLREKGVALSQELEGLTQDMENLNSDIDDIEELMEQKRNSLKRLDSTKEELSECKSSIKDIELDIKAHKANINHNLTKEKSAQDDIEQSKGKIQAFVEKCKELDEKVGQPCPVCGKPLDKDSVHKATQEYQDSIEKLKDSILDSQHKIEDIQLNNKALRTEIAQCQDKHNKLLETQANLKSVLAKSANLQESYDKMEKRLERAKLQLHQINTDIAVKKSDIKHNVELLANLDNDLRRVKEEVNPYIDMTKSIQFKIAMAKEDLAKMRQEMAPLKSKKECLEFWEKAYSNQGIKSFILDDITPFLNRRVNKYLSKLTSGQIEVIFSTRSTLKTGEERERFSIDVVNRNGGSTYISNSGGEKKRIDLSINLALQDLVASRSSKKINVAMFDEVFDSLDENGIDGVVSLLQELSATKSTILVVSHNEYLKSYFTNIITVTKINGVSSLKSVDIGVS